MTKELWINLPVKNIERSVEFFDKLGFDIKRNSPGFSDTSAPFSVGTKGVMVMLFEQGIFASTSCAPLADTSRGTEVLFSFDADTRAEVDAMAQAVTDAGGSVFSPPAEVQGWMYGFAFSDLDGHRWNMLHMDMSKMKR